MSKTPATESDSTGEGRLSDRVRRLMKIMKSLADRGRQSSDVTVDDWAPLAELVEVDDFERMGPFHDAMDWAAYTSMLTGWVNHSDGWEPVVRRISDAPGVVYVQCEEMITEGDRVFPFYSLSMYEFDDAAKIRRIHVYMQQEMPAGDQGR